MYQHVTVVGNVGRDAEMRYTPAGVPVASFSVAVNRNWTNAAGEKQEKVTWFRITCWRKLAETAAQWVKKGKLLLITGEVEAQGYTDKDGNVRATLELTANSFKFLGGKRDDAEGDTDGPTYEAAGPSVEDEIPF